MSCHNTNPEGLVSDDWTNTVTISATDTDTPPEVTTQNWQFNVPAVSRTFTYDANGNTLTDGVRTMTWDAKNRLKTVTVGANTWKWDYDYRDRRVKEYLNNAVTKLFIWSGNEIVQERTAANTITRTHYSGGFSDGATPTSGTKYQTLTDHLGNIREVLTSAGVVAARYDYTPYQGPVQVGAATVVPTFLTIGRYYHHAGSSLELAKYRAYDPAQGRWMSEDPLEEYGGQNLYEYVDNDPIEWIDRLGLMGSCGPGGPPPGWKPPHGDPYHDNEYDRQRTMRDCSLGLTVLGIVIASYASAQLSMIFGTLGAAASLMSEEKNPPRCPFPKSTTPSWHRNNPSPPPHKAPWRAQPWHLNR